ncbi:hypothetical protein GALL_204610 [mine drainage metagenome]|uniref:Phage integrase family protein n=1 Tax=mine drainage metagenome TaxID=410659 RepID=A0A1J5RPA9_9ZZZZ
MSLNIQIEVDFIKKVVDMIHIYQQDHIDTSEKTKLDYKACYNRLSNKRDSQNDDILALAAKTKSKNTWYKRRAAITHVCIDHLVHFKDQQVSKLKELGNTSISNEERSVLQHAWVEQLSTAKQYVKLLEDMPTACPILKSEQKKRTSKRHHMKKLPSDWRQKILNEAIETWSLPIHVLAITGCRPEELKKGIHLEVKNNQLVCRIESSKVKDGKISVRKKIPSSDEVLKRTVNYHAGQKWREIYFDLGKYPMVDALAATIRTSASIEIKNASSMTSTIRAIAKKLWPERKKSITAYCFRHALGSDMKSSGMVLDDISIALGHAVSATRSYYGQAKMSKGGHIPSLVIGSRQVKQSKKSPLPVRKSSPKTSAL